MGKEDVRFANQNEGGPPLYITLARACSALIRVASIEDAPSFAMLKHVLYPPSCISLPRTSVTVAICTKAVAICSCAKGLRPLRESK